MKKPEITKGEWIFKDDGMLYVGIKNDHPLVPINPRVCTMWCQGFKKTRVSNAKAISAVPEMIDALIEYTDSKAGPTKAYDKAIIALKKAGCTE